VEPVGDLQKIQRAGDFFVLLLPHWSDSSRFKSPFDVYLNLQRPIISALDSAAGRTHYEV
jgi:hypothetical protein